MRKVGTTKARGPESKKKKKKKRKKKGIYFKSKTLPRTLRKRGTRAFISKEQGYLGRKLRGTGNKDNFGNMGNQWFHFGEQGNKVIVSVLSNETMLTRFV